MKINKTKYNHFQMLCLLRTDIAAVEASTQGLIIILAKAKGCVGE